MSIYKGPYVCDLGIFFFFAPPKKKNGLVPNQTKLIQTKNIKSVDHVTYTPYRGLYVYDVTGDTYFTLDNKTLYNFLTLPYLYKLVILLAFLYTSIYTCIIF